MPNQYFALAHVWQQHPAYTCLDAAKEACRLLFALENNPRSQLAYWLRSVTRASAVSTVLQSLGAKLLYYPQRLAACARLLARALPRACGR